MLRSTGLCFTGRLGGIERVGSSARILRYAGAPLQSRSLSLASSQRGRSNFLPHNQPALPGRRNYWWSSAPIPPPATPIAPVVETAVAVNTSALDNVVAASSAPVTDAAFVPDVPAIVDAPGFVETTLSSLPDPSLLGPLQYGDLAALGLASWSPSGFCVWGMEILQVSTGMPWFWTIVGAGLLSRVLLFPLSVITMKQSVALIPYQPEVNALRLDMVKAQRSGDPLQMQKAVLKQRVLYEKIGVSMPVMMTAPFMQLPVTLGMFFGIKSMCELPLEQLKWSGLEFLPDLTVTDPTYILPIVATIAMNVQLTAGMQDMSAAPQMPHIINFFRVLSLVGIYFMATLPSGVVVYITTSIIAMVAQTFLLRVSFVRRALGVPVLAKGTGNKPASMMESVEYAKKFFSEKMEDAKQDAIKARTKGRK